MYVCELWRWFSDLYYVNLCVCMHMLCVCMWWCTQELRRQIWHVSSSLYLSRASLTDAYMSFKSTLVSLLLPPIPHKSAGIMGAHQCIWLLSFLNVCSRYWTQASVLTDFVHWTNLQSQLRFWRYSTSRLVDWKLVKILPVYQNPVSQL